MMKKKTKSGFVGIKVTKEQAELLAQLQKSLDLPTKTDVLLEALNSLAQAHPFSSGLPSQISLNSNASSGRFAPEVELAQLAAEAKRLNTAIQETRSRAKEVTKRVAQELYKTDEIIDKYKGDKSQLIQVMLQLQKENNWLSEDALSWVSQKLGVPLREIYHVATFYKAFSLTPRGRHEITVCLGTACQVRGAPRLLDRVSEIVKLKPGETSRNLRFTLSTVNCLGCCALGPVMMIDGKYYSKPTNKEIEQITAACE